MLGYLVVNGLIFLLIGLRALFKPIEAVAIPNGLEADNVDAKNYLRSAAGGVTVACACVLLGSVLLPALQMAALVLTVTVLAGLVFGRLFSVAVDGLPGPVAWISGAVELLGLVLGAYWLHDYMAPL